MKLDDFCYLENNSMARESLQRHMTLGAQKISDDFAFSASKREMDDLIGSFPHHLEKLSRKLPQ